MKTTYKKRFLKDLNKVPDPTKGKIQKIVFEQITCLDNVQQINGIKKMKGYSECSRYSWAEKKTESWPANHPVKQLPSFRGLTG